ncbi:MAG: helix-turn-helix transcriptional regulator [Bacteroidetes bacterium]|nr:helix-turn-helix transcriptional regulator [Bacteroidota bacterium]
MKNWLKVERAKINITQAKLAEELNVTRQTINSIELNKFVPSTVIALRLAKFFNVKVEDIFFLDDNEL